jgi:hypothetical protein
MSFRGRTPTPRPTQGSGAIRITITGLNETVNANNAIINGMPSVSHNIIQEAANFFVTTAKSKAHTITGHMKDQTKIFNISNDQAIVGGGANYTVYEENRPGRKESVGTTHAYLAPSAQETSKQFPSIIVKHFNQHLNNHKTGAPF